MTSLRPSTQEKYPRYQKDQRQFFNELITNEWETYQNPAWDRTRRFEVNRLFRMVAPKKILDVGCGCGFHDRLMADQSGVQLVIGIDYSEKSIEAANQAYPHIKVQRKVEDIFSMADGEHDLVVSFQVIEHLPDAKIFLQACLRQVAPGGHLAVVTPNRLRLSNRLRVVAGAEPKMGDPQHFREFVPSELRAMGEELGLQYVGGFAYGMTVGIPRTGLNLFPAAAGMHMGRLFPALADCFCVVFRRGGDA